MKLLVISASLLLLILVSQQSVEADSARGQDILDAQDLRAEIESNNNYNYKCRSEGYYVDPEDCSRYYRCVYKDGCYYPYRYNCHSGYEYDDYYKKCNRRGYIRHQGYCKHHGHGSNDAFDRLNMENSEPDTDDYYLNK